MRVRAEQKVRSGHARVTFAERQSCSVFRCPFARGCLRPGEFNGEIDLDFDAFSNAVCLAPCVVCRPMIEEAVARLAAQRSGN